MVWKAAAVERSSGQSAQIHAKKQMRGMDALNQRSRLWQGTPPGLAAGALNSPRAAHGRNPRPQPPQRPWAGYPRVAQRDSVAKPPGNARCTRPLPCLCTAKPAQTGVWSRAGPFIAVARESCRASRLSHQQKLRPRVCSDFPGEKWVHRSTFPGRSPGKGSGTHHGGGGAEVGETFGGGQPTA